MSTFQSSFHNATRPRTQPPARWRIGYFGFSCQQRPHPANPWHPYSGRLDLHMRSSRTVLRAASSVRDISQASFQKSPPQNHRQRKPQILSKVSPPVIVRVCCSTGLYCHAGDRSSRRSPSLRKLYLDIHRPTSCASFQADSPLNETHCFRDVYPVACRA